ncbi:MAG: ATP-binding cassette domain-containing protein, partial [Clostridiales bacterium]|nr:ATP-binding cassette domain-containing protein [Clostridiales bacterium]
TIIGERGYGISEGQAQRIAIARALIKKAPFLILDEATSSLDEKTELSVLQGIRDFTPRPTCLLITHRRSVLAYCDREIKIQNNQLMEIDLNS